jgi:small subunit ribosomal protein S17
MNIENTGKKRELEGIVESISMQDTIKVRVDTVTAHPRYRKVVNKKKVFFAHTKDEYAVGDKVVIRESRPYSKNVRWVVIKKK